MSEFEHTVIEYVTRDGESNGAPFGPIGFKKSGSGHKILLRPAFCPCLSMENSPNPLRRIRGSLCCGQLLVHVSKRARATVPSMKGGGRSGANQAAPGCIKWSPRWTNAGPTIDRRWRYRAPPRHARGGLTVGSGRRGVPVPSAASGLKTVRR